MKILHVAMGIAPESGGPTRSVKGLCRALARSGADVSLLVLVGDHEFENPCGVKVIRGLVNFSGVDEFDVVHLHGLWCPKLHFVVRMCKRAGKPYVISPRGMLDPWALSVKKWKKRLAMFLYQRDDLKHAAAFHVTAPLEEKSVRGAGFLQPCIISHNGVDFPSSLPAPSLEKMGCNHTAIFMSRLHPGKGLLLLAEAWNIVRPVGWRMLVVGPDVCGHKEEVIACINRLGVASDWQFVDMVDDVNKWRYYSSSDLLVHPSVSENFGITIAEALAAGIPVICTDGTPWKEVAERGCGWYVKAGSVDDLAAALREATSSASLVEFGLNGRKLIEEKYTWMAASVALVKGYEEIVNERN